MRGQKQQTKTTGKRTSRLSTKMAMITTVILVIVFSIIIGYSALSTEFSVSNAVSGEFNAIAKVGSYQVQSIIDTAVNAAKSIDAYILKAYQLEADGKRNMAGEEFAPDADKNAKINKSIIFPQFSISEINSDIEKYMIELARSTVKVNEDIEGMGIMFEPYKYDNAIRDFSFYINENNMDDEAIQVYGSHTEYSQELFYKDAMQAGKMTITDPYEHDGKMICSAAMPIIFNGEKMGVLVVDFNVGTFSRIEINREAYPTMYVTIYNDNGNIVYDSDDTANVGVPMASFFADPAQLAAVQQKMSEGQAFYMTTKRENGAETSRFYYPIKAGESTWWALTALQTSDMNKAVTATVSWLLGISIVSLAILILIIISVLRRMLAPIQEVVVAAESISNGRLDVDIKAKSNDEIGQLATAFSITAHGLKMIIDDLNFGLGALASGDFTVESNAKEYYIGDFAPLAESMYKIIDRLTDTLAQINNASEQVASGSEQVSNGAQELSQGATEQASSIQELAATIAEISEKITKNAIGAENAKKETENTGVQVMHSNEQMQEMIAAMNDISGKSAEISKIIKTIEDIAFQTNILALNAAVEAARAGAAGKGFAVVADEVRNLAGKSAEAAKNTTSLIEETVRAVENGTRIADSTAKAMLGVVTGAKAVEDLIDSISLASNEQASAIGQVTQGVDQIAAVVQTNSATAEQSAAASEELSSQAQTLKSLVSVFKLNNQKANEALTSGLKYTEIKKSPKISLDDYSDKY